MKIIITGDGKVGHNLSENLSKDGNDVTIIDRNIEALKRSDELLDVLIIKGNGANAKTLIDAGIKEADLMIAATNSDEMNMVCCLTAKRLGAKRTIARIRDPEYADDLSMLKQELGLDMVINPEMAAADEIANLIRFPFDINIESFSKGLVEMVEFKVLSDDIIADKTIRQIPIIKASSAIVGAAARANELFIPDGNFIIKKNDTIYIFGKPHSVYDFCSALGKCELKTKTAMLVGGGRIAYYLTNLLTAMDIKVKIIENDKERCQQLSEILPNTLIIYGDGTDEVLLKSEGVDEMDVFISMTGSDEENLMSAMLAKQLGVPKVIPKVSRTNYLEVIRNMGMDTVVNPKMIITEHILKYVKGIRSAKNNSMEALYKIIDGRAEIIEFIANGTFKYYDTPLKELSIRKDVMIGAIIRRNDVIIPHGKDVIKKWDRVIVISRTKTLNQLEDIVQGGGQDFELQNNTKKPGYNTGS